MTGPDGRGRSCGSWMWRSRKIDAYRRRTMMWRAAPVWSPDGRWIAYDGAAEGKQGLAIAHPDGSGATFLTEAHGTNAPLPGTGAEVTWSPDSKQIAFISATPGPETADATGDPMVITRYLYKPDAGEGITHFNDNRRLHIFMVDVATKTVRQTHERQQLRAFDRLVAARRRDCVCFGSLAGNGSVLQLRSVSR